MSNLNVIRAWKDAQYRRSLSAAELAELPENPARLVELTDRDLRRAGGFAGAAIPQTTALTCTATVGGCCPEGTAIWVCPPDTTFATCTATFGPCCE